MRRAVAISISLITVLATLQMYMPLIKVQGSPSPLDIAEKAAIWIMDEAISEAEGYKWEFHTAGGKTYYPSEVGTGAAGPGMLFLSLYEETQNETYLLYAKGAANWIITQAISSEGGYKWPHPDDTLSDWWLSTTVSEIGEFLLRTYRMTNDSTYLNHADGAARWLAAMAYWGEPGCFIPYNPPGMYGSQASHGIAPGREAQTALFLLHIYQETGDAIYRGIVEGTATWLISGPDKIAENGGYKWRHNRPYGSNYGINEHSQIALFFYETYQALGNPEYLEHAEGAMTWILSQAILDVDKVKWPNSPGSGHYATLPFMGEFVGAEPEACNLLKVAYSITSNVTYLENAKKLANWVASLAVEEEGGYKFPSYEGGLSYSGYLNARVYNFLAWMYNATGVSLYSERAEGAITWIVYDAEAAGEGYRWRTLTYSPYYAAIFGPGAAGIGYYLALHLESPPSPTKILFDEMRAGADTLENEYSDLVTALQSRRYIVDSVDTPLNMTLLSENDVLVITCPFDTYSIDELDAIDNFVKSGGGILLMGQWQISPPILNITGLNQVAGLFGTRYLGSGPVRDPDWGVDEFMPVITLFDEAHPVCDAIGSMGIYGGRPLSIEGDATSLAWGDNNTYGDLNNNGQYDTDEPRGSDAIVMAATQHGEGRAVFISDTDLFDNDFLLLEDNELLFFNIMDWLSHRVEGPEPPPPFGITIQPSKVSMIFPQLISANISIVSLRDFALSVELSVLSDHSTLQISINPTSVNVSHPQTSLSILDISTTPTTLTGTHYVSIQGRSGNTTIVGVIELSFTGSDEPFAILCPSLEVFRGWSGTFNVMIKPIGSFNSPVNLSVVDPPYGVNVSSSKDEIPPWEYSAITITASSEATQENYILRLVGSSRNATYYSLPVDAIIWLKVKDPDPPFWEQDWFWIDLAFMLVGALIGAPIGWVLRRRKKEA